MYESKNVTEISLDTRSEALHRLRFTSDSEERKNRKGETSQEGEEERETEGGLKKERERVGERARERAGRHIHKEHNYIV